MYIGLNELSGVLMAVKEVNFGNEDTVERDSLISEIELLSSLNHPNIVSYLHTEVTPRKPNGMDQTNSVPDFQLNPQGTLFIFTEWSTLACVVYCAFV